MNITHIVGALFDKVHHHCTAKIMDYFPCLAEFIKLEYIVAVWFIVIVWALMRYKYYYCNQGNATTVLYPPNDSGEISGSSLCSILVGTTLTLYKALLLLSTNFNFRLKNSPIKQSHEKSSNSKASPTEKLHVNSVYDEVRQFTSKSSKIYLCSTMWHETRDEMEHSIRSICRLDLENDKVPYTLESHIMFDDAFNPHHYNAPSGYQPDAHAEIAGANLYVSDFISVIDDIVLKLYGSIGFDTFNRSKQKYRTPYGGLLRFELPKSKTPVHIHLKDAAYIKIKKRWSQVMYLNYFKLYLIPSRDDCKPALDTQSSQQTNPDNIPIENSYLFIFDGDIYFPPQSLTELYRALVSAPSYDNGSQVAAVFGRRYPAGKGHIKSYQDFGYAVLHWLEKTGEHVYGDSICCVGNFGLYKASALLDLNNSIVEAFQQVPCNVFQKIQCDMAEDRYLSLLLFLAGHRIAYTDGAYCYPHVPSTFDEYFNQRRRWLTGTFVNTWDFIKALASPNYCNSQFKMVATETVRINKLQRTVYILHHLSQLTNQILSPSISLIYLMLMLHYTSSMPLFRIAGLILVLNAIYICIGLMGTPNLQLKFAKFLCFTYATILFTFLAWIFYFGLIHSSIPFNAMNLHKHNATSNTWQNNVALNYDQNHQPNNLDISPYLLLTTPFVLFMTVGLILHPIEAFGIIKSVGHYLIFSSSMSSSLPLYAYCNLNQLVWGTREKSKSTINDGDVKSCAHKNLPFKWWNSPWFSQPNLKDYKACVLSANECAFWEDLLTKQLSPNRTNDFERNQFAKFLQLRNKVITCIILINALLILGIIYLQSTYILRLPNMYMSQITKISTFNNINYQYTVTPAILAIYIFQSITRGPQFLAMIYYTFHKTFLSQVF